MKNLYSKYKRFWVPIFIFLGILLLSLDFFPWNASMDRIESDLLFRLRGQRQAADSVALVYIGAEDIAVLDGWPLSRDYYSYMTHILTRSGARVIAYDIFFDSPDKYYSEYDLTMSEFIHAAGNVCIPMVFASLEKTKGIPAGRNPRLPIRRLADNAAGIGFSNLNAAAHIRKTPLLVKCADSLYTSFGLEMARVFLQCEQKMIVPERHGIRMFGRKNACFIPSDSHAEFLINHFGGLGKITSYSFVDVLKAGQNDVDSLNFRGKLVLVAVTAPGYASLRSTPYADTFPASLVHLSAAENIIADKMIHNVPLSIRWVLLALMVFIPIVGWQKKRPLLLFVVALAVYLLLAVLLFHGQWILPLFYPVFGLACSTFYIILLTHFRKKTGQFLLQQEINRKQQEIARARKALQDVQEKLAAEKKEKQAKSLQTQRTLEEKQTLIRELEKKLRDLEFYVLPETHQVERKIHAPEIICAQESSLNDVLALAAKAGTDTIPVLILGETGTGKEVISRYVHRCSQRKDGPFVAFNCGALADTLLESELFGHEKGSFTGAYSTRKGRFELADGGTIFLDEITETSPAFQTKLLRVLQEGIFERVGGEKSIQVDVRVIVATNRNLKQCVENGGFREDLYYRLNAFPIQLPPLRDRRCDIPLLAVHFLTKYGQKGLAFSDRVMQIMDAYFWPGNVRELENVVRRGAILAKSDGRKLVRELDLPPEVRRGDATSENMGIVTFEDQVLDLLRGYQFSHSAISQTAKSMGNKDRGTITEHFRGLCFEYLCQNNFDIDQTARVLAATKNKAIVTRVRRKIRAYLHNLDFTEPLESYPEVKDHPSFKGLPQKYHEALQKVFLYFQKTDF
ncbi:sigma 54-interacting transcriptional regulator [candidate division KSB1 bacterium]|nr:sigma 54-interacting transcriptional regulator [candidate division KSB1 bacterium]